MQRNNGKSKQARNAGGAVRAPAAQNRSSRQSGRQSARYKECERIGTIAGATSYTVVSNIACQPGLSGSFPWLSGHAALFEKYKVHKLVYRYKNLKGTDSDGNIIMSFDYDTLDAAPSTAIEQCQSTRWIDGAPWRIFELHVPTDGRMLFNRVGPVSVADLKTYDMGRLFIAAEGCADTSDHGILEVEYDIELFEKQPSQLSSVANRSVSVFSLSSSSAATATFNFDEEVTNPLGIVNTSGVYALPAGAYLVTVDLHSSVQSSPVWQLELDDLALSPPCVFTSAGSGSNSATGYVESNGNNSLSVSLESGSATMVADVCRLIIRAL